MLPNKMKITENAFNSLRRVQVNTGLTVNVGARIAFFASVESNFTYSSKNIDLKHRELDKYTWLGSYVTIVEMLLKEKYPNLENRQMYYAWATHVEHGSTIIETRPNLVQLIDIF